MGAYVIDSVLFRDQFGTDKMRDIFSDESTVQRWLDVEAALAKVQVELGIIPLEAGEEIQRKSKVENIDLVELKREMDRTAHPIVPLLRAMKKVCDDETGEFIHWGATTQDIMDTGTILQVRDGLDEIEDAYRQLYENVRTLAQTYRDQVMVGRSHGQHALPITFGFKAAGWAEELRRNFARLKQMRER
ncbi:MAG: lyase family protein, partial [Advenella sp.]